MRSHKAVFALGFFIMVGAGLMLVGCSSDELPTGGTVTINKQYASLESEINSMVDSTVTLFAQNLDLFIESRSHTDTMISIGDFGDYLESSYDSVLSSPHWYVLFDLDMQSAYNNVRIDSMIFTDAGVPMRMAVDADAMIVKRTWELAYAQTAGSYSDYLVVSDFDFTGLNTDVGMLTGDVELAATIQNTEGTSTITTYDIDADFRSLTVSESGGSWESGIPQSGICQITAVVGYKIGAAPIETSNWTVDITFTNGVMDVEMSDGLVSRSYQRDLN